MNPYDSLKSLDEIIMKKHEGVAEKLNDAFGWTKYEVAKHINYARFPLIIGGNSYFSYVGFSEGDIGSGILISLLTPIFVTTTILDNKEINEKIEKQKDNNQEYRNIISSELTLDTYINPGFSSRLLDFIWWPGMSAACLSILGIANVSKSPSEENSILPSVILISGIMMYSLIKGSVKYLSDSDNNKPKKGKFFEKLDSIRETAKYVGKSLVPGLRPMPSLYAGFAGIKG